MVVAILVMATGRGTTSSNVESGVVATLVMVTGKGTTFSTEVLVVVATLVTATGDDLVSASSTMCTSGSGNLSVLGQVSWRIRHRGNIIKSWILSSEQVWLSSVCQRVERYGRQVDCERPRKT